MNGRQAAKKAAKRIEEQEYMIGRYTQDTKDYNACILGMIAGKSPCEWCEENRLDECTHASRGSAGCSEWWLKNSETEANVTTMVLAGKPEGGELDGEEVQGETSDNTVQRVEEQ